MIAKFQYLLVEIADLKCLGVYMCARTVKRFRYIYNEPEQDQSERQIVQIMSALEPFQARI